MSAALAPTNDFTFARSESGCVGMQGSLMDRVREWNRKEKQWERDNAPRVVAGLHLIGDVVGMFTLNPFMIAYSVFSISGRMLAVVYGSKDHQKKLAEEKAQGKHQNLLGDSWTDNIRKVFSPRKYPVESSSGFMTVGEVFESIYGATLLMGSGGKQGYTPFLVGMLAVWSYGNIVFGKEKKDKEAKTPADQPLVFSQSASKPVGFMGKLKQKIKDSPVFISSLVLAIGLIAGPFIEGLDAVYKTYALIGAAALIIQMVYVRKHDFNVEGAGEDKKNQPTSFQDRLEQQRGGKGDLGLQPV